MSSKKFRIFVGREIRVQYPEISLETIAKTLNIAKSTLGYHLKLPYKDQILVEKIRETHETNPYYGHRRIALELCLHKKRIRRVMKLANIQAITKKRRKFIKEDDKKFSPLPIPNLTKKRIAEKPNEIWRSDFTHIQYEDEILYLSTIIDEFSKDVIAYKISFRHKKELILETLDEAIKFQIQNNLPVPLILHSDQGSEYRSYDYQKKVSNLGILLSYSKKASPWQNSYQESFYGKFKLELGDISRFESIEEVIIAIHHQIYYYNHKRIHTILKMPPKVFVEKWMKGEILVRS